MYEDMVVWHMYAWGTIVALYFTVLLFHWAWQWVNDVDYPNPPEIYTRIPDIDNYPDSVIAGLIIGSLGLVVMFVWFLVYPALVITASMYGTRAIFRVKKRIAPLVAFAHKHKDKTSYDRLDAEDNKSE